MRYCTILLLFLFFLTSHSFAQVRVYGHVVDLEGNPMELASVLQQGTNNSTLTNASGFYELFLINTQNLQDSVEVIFSFMGESISRVVSSNNSTRLNVKMEQRAIELTGIEIRSWLNQLQTTTQQVIDVRNIRLMPATDGIEGILATFPGIQTTELSSQYSVRGGSFDENIIYVNNIKIHRPLLIRAGQQEGLSFINPNLVESVSFSAGGFEAKFGDRMSSVLDIRYRRPSSFEGSVSVSLLGASAYVGTSSNRFTQIHGFRYHSTAYLLGTLENRGEYNPRFIDYQTYLTFSIAPRWEVTFLGNFSQNTYEFIPQSRETSFGTMDAIRNFTVFFSGREKSIFRTSLGAFSLNFNPTNRVNLSLIASAFHTNEEETFDITGRYWLSELSDEVGGTVLGIGSYHQHARNRLRATVMNVSHRGSWERANQMLRWGVSYQREMIMDRISEWEMRDSAGHSIAAPPLIGFDPNRNIVELYSNLSGQNTLNTHRIQAFVQNAHRWDWSAGTFSAILGVRANYWTFNNELLVSPRLSLAFMPEWRRTFGFRFATGLYYQAPFYRELRYNVRDENGNNIVMLNRDIRAQRTIHFVLGADYFFRSWGRPFKLTAEAYYMLGDRLIPYVVDNVRIRYLSREVTQGYTFGVDLKLFGEMLPGTDSWFGVSWMRSRERVEGGYISRPNEQRYSIVMFFQDYFPTNPRYRVHFRFLWADGLPFGPPNSPRHHATLRTPPYRRVDLGASRILAGEKDNFMNRGAFRHLESMWLTLEVFNLLNIRNVNSYQWITSADNIQFAVPNYLTSRRINLKLTVDF